MNSKIMKMMVVALALASFNLMGCDTTVKDADGNSYPTVKIGNQVWMAKNLNVNVPGSMCYENDPANCEKYGRLYTWEAAKMACPSGWHLPSRGEFETLLANVGASEKERSKNLRAGSWENGKDKYGFSALPAGYYYSNNKEFNDLGYVTYFWSSTEDDSYYAYALVISGINAYVNYSGKDFVNSVRCLQDSNEGGEASSQRSEAQPPSGTLKDSRDGQAYKTVKIGNQVWMAKNLNVNVPGSMCYENDPANCEKYGRLYTWEAAKMACPSGWHLPSREEFDSFLATVGASEEERSENLRAGSWKNGKDKYGFSALPAGAYGSYYKEFDNLGDITFFWSSTEYNCYDAYDLHIGGSYAFVYNLGQDDGGYSVRCLQDSN